MEVTYVNLFIPTKLLRSQSGLLLGYYRSYDSVLYVNITAMASADLAASNQLGIVKLGEITVLGTLNTEDPFLIDKRQFWTKLKFDNDGELQVISTDVSSTRVDGGIVTQIFYDSRDFMSSQLFGKSSKTAPKVPFVDFLIDTLRQTSNLFRKHIANRHRHAKDGSGLPMLTKENIPRYELDNLQLMLPRRLTASFIEFHHEIEKPKPVKAHVRNKSWFPNQRTITNAFQDLVMMTTTGNQLKYRLKQGKHCWEAIKDLRHKRLSVEVGNALSSVALDIVIGLITTWILIFYSSPSHWLDVAMKHTDNVVNEVQSLLNLLMGMPAGLKLNRPLNTALGQFFLYHIYLWKTYMIIIKPVFAITVETLVFCGVFGFTCILSVLCDIVSLATIHIYCFYGYAARLYGLQVLGLSALWRLFRGKKWNQLRSRVDSYSYGNDQLFIGTLSFTILLFLLPTVLMYYLVFLVLRVFTLSVQGALRFLIEHLSSMPIYMIILWIGGSKKVAGEVNFEAIYTANDVGPVQLRLKTKKVSFKTVLMTRNDELKSPHSTSRLSWSDFLNSVFWGKIIYPM